MNVLNTLRLRKVAVHRCFLFAIAFWVAITPLTSSAYKEEKAMGEINVYIVHGFMASPSDHWFQWLKEKLEERGISVKVLELPDSSAPNPIVWQKALYENIDRLNRNTFFVAHSLGCVSLLTYLQENINDKSIGGLVLVSGFVSPLPKLPQLNDFVEYQFDFEKIISAVKQRTVIGSPQDSIVPYYLTREVAKYLESNLYSIDDAGHFLADDGYDTFPYLLEILLTMISREPPD